MLSASLLSLQCKTMVLIEICTADVALCHIWDVFHLYWNPSVLWCLHFPCLPFLSVWRVSYKVSVTITVVLILNRLPYQLSGVSFANWHDDSFVVYPEVRNQRTDVFLLEIANHILLCRTFSATYGKYW